MVRSFAMMCTLSALSLRNQSDITKAATESWVKPKSKALSRPLHEYWIMSSHNTFLTGWQYGFEGSHGNVSNGDGYTHALDKSSRFLEIDLWCKDNRLEVFHGASLGEFIQAVSPQIPFEKVVDSIKEWHEKHKDHSPIILTIGFSCEEVDTLNKAAEMFVEAFGADLTQTEDADAMTDTFTPDNLKNKILVRGKTIPRTKWDNMTALGKTKDWNTPHPRDVRSMPVSGFEKEIVTRTDVLEINQKMITKVYLDGTKQILSQNVDPLPMWGLGVQVLAFNLQTFDKHYVVNRGLFQETDGYVLKPKGTAKSGTLTIVVKDKKNDLDGSVLSIRLLHMGKHDPCKFEMPNGTCNVLDAEKSMLVLLQKDGSETKAGNAARVSELKSGEVTVHLTNMANETKATLSFTVTWNL